MRSVALTLRSNRYCCGIKLFQQEGMIKVIMRMVVTRKRGRMMDVGRDECQNKRSKQVVH